MTCDRLERDGLLGDIGGPMDPHVTECDDCRSRRDEYAGLVAVLALESARPLPSDWKERTLARWHRERACRRRRAGLAGFGAAAAAAVALVFALRHRDAVRAEPQLALSFEKGPGTWRGPAHHPGDRAIAAPSASAPHFELRLYLERELLARCPGGSAGPARPDRESAAGGAREVASLPNCRPKGDVVELSYELVRSGDYQVFLLVSSSPLPAPSGDLDADLRAARKAGAVVGSPQQFEVY